MDIITSKRGSWTRQRVDWKVWKVASKATEVRKYRIIQKYRTIRNHRFHTVIPRLARPGKSNCLSSFPPFPRAETVAEVAWMIRVHVTCTTTNEHREAESEEEFNDSRLFRKD